MMLNRHYNRVGDEKVAYKFNHSVAKGIYGCLARILQNKQLDINSKRILKITNNNIKGSSTFEV